MKPGRANEKEYVYTRGISAARDADFSSAVPFGKAKLGKDSIFWKKGLKWYCLDFREAVRVFRRIAEVNARVCCGNSNFDIQMLVFIMFDGRELEVLIGDSLHRYEAENLYAALREAHPELHYGKPE
ncbi:MAG: hypothetical protein IJY96_02455 [Oscillospiraceae bacterium]|nr:hypothetical protein [Oscillospiraceae bacterium]